MRRLLLIGLVTATLGLLIVGLATPIFAHGPDDGATPTDGETWEEMHEACTNGDWEAMDEAAREMHGEGFSDMPCHGEGDYASANGRDMMGGGMMGGGMMGGMY